MKAPIPGCPSRAPVPTPGRVPGPVGRGEAPDHEDRQQRERDVDQEQRLPAHQAHQQAAHHGPDGGRRGVGHLDPAQRPGGLHVRLPRQRADHDDGARVRRRGAERHERAGHAEQREVGREGRQRAGHGHQGHAQHEQPPRPEPVREPAHQRLAGRGGEVEGGDHPGDCGDVEPEVLAQHHQGDGDHRRVQRVQRRAEAEACDGEAGALAGLVAGAWRVAHGNSLPHRSVPRRTLSTAAPCTPLTQLKPIMTR